MAKGNDGNLLQHGIEAELAWKLYEMGGKKCLHLVSTHGMAPEESFEAKKTEHKIPDDWLSKSFQPSLALDAPRVAFAYRECQATHFRYPNTGEIIAALVGRANVKGLIIEKDSYKHSMLEYKWRGSELEPICDSWRNAVVRFFPAKGVSSPWLFSMDPMTIQKERGDKDDANLYPEDLRHLEPVFKKYVNSGQPGAISIFCYTLKRLGSFDQYRFFIDEMTSLAGKLQNTVFGFCGVQRSNRDLGAIIATDQAILDSATQAWKTLIPAKSRVS